MSEPVELPRVQFLVAFLAPVLAFPDACQLAGDDDFNTIRFTERYKSFRQRVKRVIGLVLALVVQFC